MYCRGATRKINTKINNNFWTDKQFATPAHRYIGTYTNKMQSIYKYICICEAYVGVFPDSFIGTTLKETPTISHLVEHIQGISHGVMV